MNHTYETTIMEGDFDGAVRGSCRRCLVANAFRRLTEEPDVQVGPSIGGGKPMVCFPREVYEMTKGSDIILEFDRRAPKERLLGRTIEITRIT